MGQSVLSLFEKAVAGLIPISADDPGDKMVNALRDCAVREEAQFIPEEVQAA